MACLAPRLAYEFRTCICGKVSSRRRRSPERFDSGQGVRGSVRSAVNRTFRRAARRPCDAKLPCAGSCTGPGVAPAKAATAASPDSDSRIGHSGRSSPWQDCTRCCSVSFIASSSCAFCSSARICDSAKALTSRLGRLRFCQSPRSSRNLRNREAQVARVADEAQRVHVALAVLPIAGVGAGRGRHEADCFVVPDHLGRDARGLRGLADVHRLHVCPFRHGRCAPVPRLAGSIRRLPRRRRRASGAAAAHCRPR